MPQTLHLLSPVAPAGVKARPLNPRPDSLAGKRVGFLDNRKHNADLLFARISALLQERYGVASVTFRQKATSSIPAPATLLAELAGGCDLVIAGSGD